MAQRRLSHPEAVEPPLRPRLADQPSRLVQLEREVELEYRPQRLGLQRKVNTVAEEARASVPACPPCGQPRAITMRVRFPAAHGGGCKSLHHGTVARSATGTTA